MLDDPEHHLSTMRKWQFDFQGRRFKWTEIDDLARERNLRIRTKDWGSGLPDFQIATRAIRVLKSCFADLGAVVLIRDSDRQIDRRRGLEEARNRQEQLGGTLPVVIGVAHTKRECWVLCGFDPRDTTETKLLAEERSYLGFSPVQRSQELTAQRSESTDKRSAKRVVSKLMRGDHNREADCWKQTNLDVLRERGNKNGLAAYLDEVKTRLVPALLPR